MKNEYFCLEPAAFKLDGGAMFGIVPKPMWNKVHPADDLNRIDLALRLLVIKKDNKVILIDTGIGDYHGTKFEERFGVVGDKSPLEKALAEINLNPLDVTDVVISHLHFDHVGGLGRINNGVMEPVLKNATLHLHKEHFEYSQHPTERDTGSFHIEYFLPVVEWYRFHNKLHFVDGMEGEILPGLRFICSMGHTPYLLHAYDEKFIYMADLIPTSNHVSIPWVMGYDISPGVTTKDKRHFLKFIHDKKLTMFFEHDPKFYGADVIMNEKGEYACGEKFPHLNKSGYAIN